MVWNHALRCGLPAGLLFDLFFVSKPAAPADRNHALWFGLPAGLIRRLLFRVPSGAVACRAEAAHAPATTKSYFVVKNVFKVCSGLD